MADNAWSEGCRPGVWWYGIPGAGSYYWTARFGTYWVGGGVYGKYATYGPPSYECGGLGPPVKEYRWLTEFSGYGMWFEGGAIYYSGGQWRVAWGDYGQTAGRLTEDSTTAPADAEVPPDAPSEPTSEQPAITPEMASLDPR